MDLSCPVQCFAQRRRTEEKTAGAFGSAEAPGSLLWLQRAGHRVGFYRRHR